MVIIITWPMHRTCGSVHVAFDVEVESRVLAQFCQKGVGSMHVAIAVPRGTAIKLKKVILKEHMLFPQNMTR